MKLAFFLFLGLTFMASVFLLLPSLSYAKKSETQVSVSATVQEHITYYKNNGRITVQTNLKNETVVIRQNNDIFVTAKI